MSDDFNEYKWVIAVNFHDNTSLYYNSFDFCLKRDPRDATRYKKETSDKIEDDKKHASSQGGVSKMILLENAIN